MLTNFSFVHFVHGITLVSCFKRYNISRDVLKLNLGHCKFFFSDRLQSYSILIIVRLILYIRKDIGCTLWYLHMILASWWFLLLWIFIDILSTYFLLHFNKYLWKQSNLCDLLILLRSRNILGSGSVGTWMHSQLRFVHFTHNYVFPNNFLLL